jgi:hypothetical protein
MTSVFINIGEGFKDEKLNIFRRQVEKNMPVICYDYAREQLHKINSLPVVANGYIFYMETDICRKNKNYIRAFCNIVTCITTEPSAIYLMPCAPKELVKVIKEQWKSCDVYLFEYDKMKASVQI